MASERELNLLIRARDEATKVIEKNKRAFDELEKSIDQVSRTTGTLNKIPEQMARSQQTINQTTNQFNQLEASVISNERSFNNLNRSMNQFGLETERSAEYMEKYRDKFMASIDKMMDKATAGESIQESFVKMGRPLQALTGKLNGVSSELEKMSRAGHPAVLALGMLGPNASMNDLYKMIQFINKGIARMQAVTIVAGLALAGFTYVMAKAAHGPNPTEVFQQQAEALQHYVDTLNERTGEIYNAWGLFEKAQIEHTSGAQLLKNLSGQVKIMQQWSSNLASLAKKGVDEGLIAELRKMGPAAAGEIAALNNMSGPELDKYVTLWKEKHKLAKVAAVTELAGLKEETKKKIQELQDSLKPLGIAFHEFKTVWREALGPFIEVWGIIAAKVVDFGTYIGELINKLNELNPGISAAAGMFMYLFTAFTLLLAPLALGISRAGGLAAAFKVLWGIIGPFTTGFLAIAGYAAVLAAAFVALGIIIYNLWKNSEDFRESITGGWAKIKAAVMDALAPLLPALKGLGDTVVKVVSDMVGGTGTMQSIWKALGDKIAVIINFLVDNVLPIFIGALKFLVSIVVGVIGNIQAVIQSGFNIIKGIFDLFGNIFKGNWSGVWENLKTIGYNALILIWNLVQLWFVGKLIGSLTAFATLGKTLLTTFWSGIKTLFTTSVNVLKTGVQAGWSFITNTITASGNLALNAIKTMWTGALNAVKTTVGAIRAGVQTAFEAIRTTINSIMISVKTLIQNGWNTAKTTVINAAQGMWTGVKNMFGNIKSTVIELKDNIINTFKSINLLEIGKNIIQGLINGILGMVDAVWSAVRSITDGIKSKIADALKIHSPSRVAIEMGGFFSEGLGIGIMKMAKQAFAAAGNLADGVMAPVNSQLTPVGAGYRVASPGGQTSQGDVYVTIETGAFSFPGITTGEEAAKAASSISLKTAFKVQ